MSGLGDFLQSKFVESGNGGSFLDHVNEMVGRHGVTGASKELGVDRRTIQRWRSGKIRNPKPPTVNKVERARRGSRIRANPPTESTLIINTTEPPDAKGRTRHRQLRGTQLKLRDGTLIAVQQAYVETGDKEVMARTFLGGIGDAFYKDFLSKGVEEGGAEITEEYKAVAVS